MHAGVRLRMMALILGVTLLGGSLAVVTLISERRATEATEHLSLVDSESFHIADKFKDRLRDVNDKMRRYASFNEPGVWQEFQEASRELQTWFAAQAPLLTTRREQAALEQMQGAYAEYLRRAEDLHTLMQSSGKPSASLADYNSFFEGSRRLLDLGQALAMAHYASRNELLSQTGRTLREFRWLVLGLLALLLGLGLALAWVVYQDLIAPLRVRLVESEALASLGMLGAGLAHEIRNPLTAIRTALFIQQSRLPPGSPALGELDLIERQVVRLERLVNDFLQFARPAQPQPVVVAADVPFAEVEKLLRPDLERSGIRLVRQECPGLLIKADLGQIQQVLINLVRNAAESIGQGGTISLRALADRQRLSADETNVVVLEVADTGKGIAPDAQKRLFDPFFTTKETGTGLGLSIAARVVEMNGGRLRFQTEPGHGATFGIVLPRAA